MKEYTDIYRQEKEGEEWRKSKKVGSLVGKDHDVSRRKALPIIAMSKITEI